MLEIGGKAMKNAFKLAFVGLAMAFTGCLGLKAPVKTIITEKKMAEEVISAEISESEAEISSVIDELSSIESEIASSEAESEVETASCTVVLSKTDHGTITTDIVEGEIGDICTITAKHDMFYKVKSVTANGTTLLEDEDTVGVYKFALVAGENTVTAKFIVDEELCKELTTIVEQVGNKDWDNLFTFENAIRVVSWLIDGGLIIAIIKYAIKDKKTAEKTEKAVTSTIEKVVAPEVKEKITQTFSMVIEPVFKQNVQDNAEMRRALAVFAKCMALSQDDSPEARKAVLDELMSLNISDQSTINDVKAYIDQRLADQAKAYSDAMKAVEEIKSKAAQAGVIEHEDIKAEEALPEYDGTTI